MGSGGKKFPVRGLRKIVARQSNPCSPVKPTVMANKPIESTVSEQNQHRVPSGDSPYVRAKHVQLVDKDATKAVPLFWAAINSGDRVDSALKDMAVVMKQVNRAEEAIEAIRSFRNLCSRQAQEPLDSVLLDLYKKCGRIDEQIELLSYKLMKVDEGMAFGGKTSKIARSQGKKFYVTLDQERSRLLGNLAWAYLQSGNYKDAEPIYRKALAIELDYNKQCNLAICLIQTGRLKEAKSLLEDIRHSSINCDTESFIKSFERASEMLMEFESQLATNRKKEEIEREVQRLPPSASKGCLRSPTSSNVDGRTSEDVVCKNLNNSKLLKEVSSPLPVGKWKRGPVTPSPMSCSRIESNESKYVASADLYSRGRKFTSQETFSSPMPISGYSKFKSRESPIISSCSVNGDEKFEAPIQNSRAATFRKPRAAQVTKVSAVKGNNAKPSIPIQSPTPIGTSGDKASKGLIGDGLSPSIGRSDIFVTGSNRQAHSVEEKVTFERWKKEKPQNPPEDISASLVTNDKQRTKEEVIFGRRKMGQDPGLDNISASITENLKLTQDSFVLNNSRKPWTGCVVEDITSGSWQNKQSHNPDNTYPSITENPKPREDDSVLTSVRRTWADMVEEEEQLASESSNYDAAFDHSIGDWKVSEHAGTPAYIGVYKKPESKFSVTPWRWKDTEAFPDENVNSNIVVSTPLKGEKVESAQKITRQNTSARRSLSFERKLKCDPSRDYTKPSLETASFEDYDYSEVMGSWSNCGKDLKPLTRRNRLRVFQEIALEDNPKA